MKLVNNESGEIIRIFNSAFNEFLDEKHAKRDFYLEALRDKIDGINEWVYDNFNNGVYKVPPFQNAPLHYRLDSQVFKLFVQDSSRNGVNR